jgi:hypothetical protein
MRNAFAVLALGLAAAFPAAALAQPPTDDPYERSHEESRTDHQLDIVKRATERFRDVQVARRAGYEAAAECVAGPDGAMGIHYSNARLIEDPRLQIRRPEILVYEPRGERRKLVAVEYFRADADGRLDTDDDRPYLFGRGFDGPMEGHEPGMPVHYDLHAWIWKHNPAGVFAQFNPRVSCPASSEAPDLAPHVGGS